MAFPTAKEGYNPNSGTFGGTLFWPQYNVTDLINGRVVGNQLVFYQLSSYNQSVKSIIAVTMTDPYHLSGTWNVPGQNRTGSIKFTINPDDVSHLLHTYKIFVRSSAYTYETADSYITTSSAGARDGHLTIKPDIYTGNGQRPRIPPTRSYC